MRGPSCRAFFPPHNCPSFRSLVAGGLHSPRTGCLGPPNCRHVRGGRKPGRNPPCNYFPRSFTISKKQPGLGERISRCRALEGGDATGAEAQNKFPSAAESEAGLAAAPGGPRRIAGGSADKVSLRCSLHSAVDSLKSSPPTGSKAASASMGEPSAASEQSGEGLAGPASGRGGGDARGGLPRLATRPEPGGPGWPYEDAPPEASLLVTPAARSSLG